MTKRNKQKRNRYKPNPMNDIMKLTTDTIKVGVVAEVGIGLIGALKK